MAMTDREQMLTAALLWIRNHYDLQHLNPELKPKVLATVDAVLADGGPVSGALMQVFREKYTAKNDADGQRTKPRV